METCRSFCIWPLLSGLDRNVHKSAKYFAMLTKGKNALVVTTEDEVYGIGVNGDSCPLGVGSNGAIIQATKVKELSGKNIKNIVGTEGENGRVVVLTKDFQIFSWGSNKFMGLGYEFDGPVAKVPTQVVFQAKFVKVAIGGNHTVAITFDKKAYAWGDNKTGQLGTGNNNSSATPVQSGVSDASEISQSAAILDIACGQMNTYYIATNDDGKKVVYTVGFGSFGALGDGEGQDSSDPVSLNLTGDLETLEFKSVFASRQSGFAISKDNRAIGWGQNDKGQIPSTDEKSVVSPVFIDKYHDIAAHCDSDMVGGISQSFVYVWGETRFGNLTKPQKTPLNSLDDIYVVYDYSRTYRLVNVSTIIIEPPKPPAGQKETIKIHYSSCNDDGFPISWNDLITNSLFFKILYQKKQISEETKDYVMVGFGKTTVKLYIEYLKTKKIDSGTDIDEIKKLLQFAIAYREFELLEYIMTKFGIFPPTPPEELTVDNVCIVYEKNTDEETRDLCIQFILGNMIPVFMSNSYLNVIKCETMRSIMKDLASQYKGMYTQLIRGRQGKNGEGIITSYPSAITYGGEGTDISSIIKEVSTTQSADRVADILAYIKKNAVDTAPSEGVTFYKCITMPRVDTFSTQLMV